ncbi:MAG: DUF2892 domain-containing protein [Gammaproteobacteria bacterium]|nr:DUF2892 domain-containing protein [Gammaproteobacteria bacterium]
MVIPHNVGLIDRIIRLLSGIALIYLGFIEHNIIPDAIFSTLVGAFGVVNIFTAAVSWCPLYHLINLNTMTNNSETS